MIYEMGLYNKPFQSIQLGKKVYEVRLYDAKRQLIKRGDHIVFTNLTTEETITVKVTEIKRYESFKEMYEQIDKKLLDCENDSLEEMLESTYKIYTKEQEEKWGTVAIHIEIVK
ncbi:MULTISPECIES: ASCH domain-containing protein [Bacillus]|uniref:ASCH domain-containing protein n=2 Tax=Bacillus cereus group TaxID=86661 RepID=A0A2A7D420_BACAN|nr:MULTISPECIES: ASCH domain-containing protein [Bacillus]MCP1164644.1 ASCH domain-containing protein [Bacillus sp. 1813sda1]MDC7971564.1 ASCH domain-containing protein [Bacillus sp. BLCC-B18]OTW71168.1 ASCH domain-containing protein [Bacillus thuringiensis serovar coreanensis]OTX41439.1 ASCH domain-containing protein [Bacillus thuringiensis serovar sooncheon]OTX47442.1 ASCH domain-containing protein [Bacillus thuringiensis serovar guiyangiensis]